MADAPSTTLTHERRAPASGRKTITDMTEDDARKRAPLSLPPVARAVYLTARAEADPTTGMMEDRTRLQGILGLSAPRVRGWLAYLEGQRWKGRQLAQRHGARELWVLLVDIPGIPQRPDAPAANQHHDRTRRTHNGDWRTLRARAGGLERAFKELKGKHTALEKRLAELLERPSSPGAEVSAAEIVALRALLAHATACADPDCSRCWDLAERLRDHDPTEPTGVELLR